MRACRCTHCLVYLVLIALLLGFAGGHADAAPRQSKSFVYSRIAVELRLQRDGTLEVTERLTLRYTGGPFTSASRDIPLNRLDAIEAIGVSKGATSYSEVKSAERNPATFHLTRDSQQVAITWFYPPISDSEQTFVLRYRVRGAVRVGTETDQLWWVAIFPNRSVPVEQSWVTLTLPPSARPAVADVSLPAASGALTIEQNTVTVIRDQPLAPGDGLDLQINLPGDLIQSAVPRWQAATNPVDPQPTPINIEPLEDPDRLTDGLPGNLVVIALAALASGGLLFVHNRRKRKEARERQRQIMAFNAKHERRPPASSKRAQKQKRGSSAVTSTAQADTGGSWSSSSSDSSWSSSSSDSSWSSSSSDSSWSSSSSDSSSSSSDSGGSGGGGGTAD